MGAAILRDLGPLRCIEVKGHEALEDSAVAEFVQRPERFLVIHSESCRIQFIWRGEDFSDISVALVARHRARPPVRLHAELSIIHPLRDRRGLERFLIRFVVVLARAGGFQGFSIFGHFF